MVRNSAVLGIDIGRDTIHAIAVRAYRQGIQIAGHHEVHYRATDDLLTPMTEIKKRLLACLPWYQRLRVPVVVGVDDDAVITKQITAPLIDDEIEQEALIGQKLSAALNMDTATLYYDFEVMSGISVQPGQACYQVVACRRHALTPALDALKHVGLSPSVADINSQALVGVYQAIRPVAQANHWPLWLHYHGGLITAIRLYPDGQVYQHRSRLGEGERYEHREEPANTLAQQHVDQACHRAREHNRLLPLSSVWISGVWPTTLASEHLAITRLNPVAMLDQTAPTISDEASIALGLALRGGYSCV